MSFADPRTKVIAIMKSLNYILLEDAFDFENVKKPKAGKSFHVEQGPITSESHDQNSVAVDNQITLRFWEKGKRDSSAGMTRTLQQLDTIMDNVMDITNRTDGVKNILFNDFSAEPFSDDNDDIIRGQISISYKQQFCFSIN